MRHFARAKRGPDSFDMSNFLWKDHCLASLSQNVISLNLASFGFIACGCGERAGEKCFIETGFSGPCFNDTIALLLCGCIFTMTRKFNCYFFKTLQPFRKTYHSVFGFVAAINIAILVMGWSHAFGEFQSYPSYQSILG